MTVKELEEMLPFTDREKTEVAAVMEHESIRQRCSIIRCLRDDANNEVILVIGNKKEQVYRGVQKNE